MKIIRPDQFLEMMKDIAWKNGSDPEGAHVDMDELMVIVLRQLGYGDGCDVFDNQHKWYA